MTKEELNKIEERLNKAQKGIWKAYIEGKDHTSGSSFIMTGIGSERGNDIELFGATEADYDFIANAKQDIPKLIAELRKLAE
ncbi:hypothetical protein [Flavobacterium saccharophilum]|uniref:Uncharacterized protein n=1 Tax=Flavobacterium saccharophilum TaxID=29534 RepID=A0A1M7GEM2_9FLAO|nr:hypothetical protein [Flavobacterium saccharophilum]SHM14407.1 hypothetical protein SAMN05444366_2510 [Flavobacterium saccharophilum]